MCRCTSALSAESAVITDLLHALWLLNISWHKRDVRMNLLLFSSNCVCICSVPWQIHNANSMFSQNMKSYWECKHTYWNKCCHVKSELLNMLSFFLFHRQGSAISPCLHTMWRNISLPLMAVYIYIYSIIRPSLYQYNGNSQLLVRPSALMATKPDWTCGTVFVTWPSEFLCVWMKFQLYPASKSTQSKRLSRQKFCKNTFKESYSLAATAIISLNVSGCSLSFVVFCSFQ